MWFDSEQSTDVQTRSRHIGVQRIVTLLSSLLLFSSDCTIIRSQVPDPEWLSFSVSPLPPPPDLAFITTWPFLWKVSSITLVSCLPLYIIKYLKRRFSPPSYSKLSSWVWPGWICFVQFLPLELLKNKKQTKKKISTFLIRDGNSMKPVVNWTGWGGWLWDYLKSQSTFREWQKDEVCHKITGRHVDPGWSRGSSSAAFFFYCITNTSVSPSVSFYTRKKTPIFF